MEVPAGTQTMPPPMTVHMFHDMPTIGLAVAGGEPFADADIDIGIVIDEEPIEPMLSLLEPMLALVELMSELLEPELAGADDAEVGAALAGHSLEPALSIQ
jgi:hypothetical protein